MPSSISPVPFRSQSPPRVMADRSSPVFSYSSSPSSSPSSCTSPFVYNSWSTADESSLYKFRTKRVSPTPLSANAKEFNYRAPQESFGYGVSQGRNFGLDSTRGSFISSSVLDWFNHSELGNFNTAAQLPILAWKIFMLSLLSWTFTLRYIVNICINKWQNMLWKLSQNNCKFFTKIGYSISSTDVHLYKKSFVPKWKCIVFLKEM